MEKLIFITNRKLSDRPLTQIVTEACEAGIRVVQLREKDLDGKSLLELAINLKLITEQFGAKLFINDRYDIALAANAEGIQLPEESFPLQAIRRSSFNTGFLIGRSVHSHEGAVQAEHAGANFVIFGHVFDTQSKSTLPSGLDELRKISSSVKVPVYAVGGISPENVCQCLQYGASGISVMSSIMQSADIQHTVNSYLTAIENQVKENHA